MTLQSGSSSNVRSARFLIRQCGRILVVPAIDIDFVEAEGRYCSIHCGANKFTHPGPFIHLLEKLPPDDFVQIRRDTVINIDRITNLQRTSEGALLVVLNNGYQVPVSRRFRRSVWSQLSN